MSNSLPNGPFDTYIPILLKFVNEVSPKILDIYSKNFEIFYKNSEREPVTEADKWVHQAFQNLMASHFSDFGFLSEEGDPFQVFNQERVWILDPIDGTKEFIKKNDEFSLMLGLSIGGEARFGLVYQPVTHEYYLGGPGWGCFYSRGGENWDPLCCQSGKYTQSSECSITVSRSHHSSRVENFKENLNIEKSFPSGSIGLKFMKIAKNEAQVYLDPGKNTKEWDLCGPQALLLGAGGNVTDTFGREYQFNRKEKHNTRGVLASGVHPALHQEFCQMARQVINGSNKGS